MIEGFQRRILLPSVPVKFLESSEQYFDPGLCDKQIERIHAVADNYME